MPSLKAAVKSATKLALAALKGMGEPITYVSCAGTGYDAATGKTTRQEAGRYTVPLALLTSYKEDDIDGQMVQKKDKRCTINAAAIKFQPNLADFIIDKDGVQWDVINTKLPPPGLLYILQVRRP